MFALIQKSLERARQHQLLDALLDRQQARSPHRRTARLHPPQRRKILFESLEPRLLLSADLLPGATAGTQDPVPPQATLQLATPPAIQAPQIHWTAPLVTGDAPLFASSLVGGYDLDNFSSPLAPVAPAGSLVYAGGVQGTLDVDGDSDLLSITLDAGQHFSLRLQPPAGLQARMEAFGPDGLSLGAVAAANAGDTLILQMRSAAAAGAYSIMVESLAGVGSYVVEIFLNAALEDPDSTDATTAQDLDPAFSALLDSPGERASVIGNLAGLLPTRTLFTEDFEDGLSFDTQLNNGVWEITTTNPDAVTGRVTQSGELGSSSYLQLSADLNPDIQTVQVDNGDGGTFEAQQYTYESALTTATWRVNLAGVSAAVLEFDHWSYDGHGDYAYFGNFFGSAEFDGVALSVGGDEWIVLQSFGYDYGYGTNTFSIDLVAAASAYGLTLGADTRIRFQMFDPGGTQNWSRDDYSRQFDNVRITTDQQELLLTPTAVVSSGQEIFNFYNPLDLLTDGNVPAWGSFFANDTNIYWFGQEASEVGVTSSELSPAAGALTGLVFGLEFASAQRVTGLLLSVDNNDDYAVDYSLDGVSWDRLVDIAASQGQSGSGMDTFRISAPSPDNGGEPSFSPVQARYLRVYATAGDGAYAIGEMQAFTDGSSDAADYYSLTLAEGDIVSFTLSLEHPADDHGVLLQLLDADGNLLTESLPGFGPVAGTIENFRAPAAGSYTVRVAGNTTGDYHLTAVKNAQFGPAGAGTQDLTLTPIVLDALSVGGSTIRVGVLGGSSMLAQLNDDTHFDFSASYVEYYQIDTAEELANFDVILMGDYVNPSSLGGMAATLRAWVEAGHGLVTTGWMNYYASLQYFNTVNADLDAVIPINLNTYSSYQYGLPTVTITDGTHPVTQGITDFTANQYAYYIYGQNGIDAGAQLLGSAFGSPAIVVATPQFGRTVALSPDYNDSGAFGAGLADRLLEQAVAWAAKPANLYTVQAQAGALLSVELDLLDSGSGQPVNDLAPVLEIYDATGSVLLASGTTLASIDVLEDAAFTIRVSGVGAGDYLLRASGNLPSVATPVEVLSTSLDGVNLVLDFPNQIDLTFSEPVLYTSLDADDLLVNGVAASSFTILSPTRVRFELADPLSGDDIYTLVLSEGSVTDIHGNTSAVWSHTITVDAQAPTVVAASVAEGGTLEPGVHTLSFELSEALDDTYLGSGDIWLREIHTNQYISLSGFFYDAATLTVSVTTTSLVEGLYEVTLNSDFYSFKDLVGNTLDGDGDGTGGDSYTLQFAVDRASASAPALSAVAPMGGLVYRADVTDHALHAAGDVDSFTFTLTAGQTLSLMAGQTSGSARMALELFDAGTGGNSLGLAEASALGQTLLLQTLAISGGTYRVEVRSLEGAARYTLNAVLNAALEAELAAGSTNDTLATAQDISNSLLITGSDRAAVLGQNIAGQQDWYTLQLGANQIASFVLTSAGSLGNTDLGLELYDAAGVLLTAGGDIAANVDESIIDFRALAAGDYFLRVTGSSAGWYNLVATRDQSFSLELQDTVQDISATGEVLGALGSGGGGNGLIAVVAAPGNNTGLLSIVAQLNDHSFANNNAIFVSATDVDTLQELSQYSAVLIGGTGNYSNQFSGFASNLRAYVEGGGGLIVTGWGIYASGGLSGQTDSDFNAIVPVNTNSYSWFSSPTINPVSGHPITDGVTSFGGFDYSEYPGSSPQVKPGATVLATVGSTPVAAVMEVGKGRSVYLGPIYSGYSGYNISALRSGEADQLLEQAVAWVAGDTEDRYRIAVNAGDTLTLRTSTPLEGTGAPGNTLDAGIELLDASGAVVATASGGAADGRNVEFVHVALSSGNYTVRVISENGSPQGAYVLSITGATGAGNQAPVVIQSNPVDGQRLAGTPTTLSFDLSHTVLASSLSVEDLTIDGGATVTGVEMVDGDTVRFTLTVPDAEGTYQYSLLAGALTGLQGGLSLAHAGSFTVDKTAPRVVSQNPEVQSISPFNTWSVTFDEAIDPTSVQTSDFLLRNPGNGMIGINSAVVSSDGLTVTLSFFNQFSQGNYQLTVGPDIRDRAGNLMDQDSATDGNQIYLGSVQVASPDLSPIEIHVTLPDGSPVPEAGAALGSQVRVNWTVRNIGTDAARSSSWYDRLYISSDTSPSGDISLGEFLVTNTSGLNGGAQYAMSALVTLPLNNSLNAGSYYLRVQADIYGYQPENDENNNSLYSAVFATVVPPLPDLTVSNVVAPAVIEAGKTITVSWTVNNQGGAIANGSSGYWYDRVLLSSDTVYGNGDDVALSDQYYFASLPAGQSLERSMSVTVPSNRTGTWYVLVQTDIYNYVYERDNENNNTGASSATVQVIIPTEDLTPISLTAPETAVFGNTIEASWTVRNAGTGPTYGNWYDRLYLSTDATLGNGDIALNYVYASESPDVRPVGAGQAYTRTLQNIQLPLNVSLTDGNYFLLLKTDDGNQEPELNEGNNVIARAISLSVPDHADLTVTDVEVPATVQSGESFEVHFTLNNAGEAAASNFYNAIYLSSNGTSLDYLVDHYLVNQSLAAGASVTVDRAITVPLYNPGTWQVIVVADSSNTIYEHASEGNNRGVSAAPVVATLPPLPDLVVSNIVAPVQALAGEAITFSWTITNQGQADFSGTWHDHVYLTNDGGSNTQGFGAFSFEGTLAAGASITRTQNLTLSATQEGVRRFVVQTDYYEQVDETPTGQLNNTTLDNTQLSITFPPLPNLQVTGITPPDEPFSGTQTTISWVVTNNGTGATSAGSWYDQVVLSLDNNWETTEDNIYLATVTNPNYLPVGESYQNSATVSIPRGLNGSYHFLVRTDVYGNVFEDSFENDNTRVTGPILVQLTPPPDLRVDAVEAPNEEFSGTPITISWTVGNHGEGPTAEAGWYDRVIMSENDILGDADDRRLGDVWHNGRLGKSDPDTTDDSYTVSHTFDLPIGVIGDFHFFVITDVNNHVYEHGSDANNSAQDMKSDGTGPELTTILLTPPPDLEVYSVTVPGAVEAGHVYTASWRVVNFGSTPTPNSSWTDRLYLSTDGILDAGDIFLRDVGRSGALAAVDYNDDGEFITGSFYDATASFTLPFNIEGAYRLIVKTDIHNQVFEGFANPDAADGEDNNQTASNTMAVANRPADLVVENLVVPVNGEAGKQVALTWTVRNTGTGDSVANNWLDQIRLSVDDILFDDDDVVLQNVFHSGVLNAGGSYTQTATVTLPFSLTGGSYRMYVLGDSNGRVTESNEANNTAFATIQVLRETPDLQVTEVTHEASGMVGLPLDVSWRVENLGANQTDAGNWYDDVFLSLDAVLDSNDTYLGLRYRNAGLAASTGYDASASFTLPATLAPNNYFVIVRTDRSNVVTEGASGESNNTRVSGSTVPVVAFDPNNPEGILPTALLRPDLRVTAVDAPADAISGQLMSVSWTVTNDAADPTGNRSWYDAVYLSRDGVLDRSADLYLGYAFQSNLAAGASYTQVLDVRVPYGQSGPFYLFVATDAGRAIAESNELNNTGQEVAFTQVALAPPADLVVGDIDIPVNGVPGQLATIQFSVQNQGSNPALGSWSDSVYLSTDDTWDINDALFGVVTHYGDVAGGESYTSSLTAALPGLTPGSYKVIVRSDIRNRIPESNETNNIQGTLDSMALDVEALNFNTSGVATDSGTLGEGQAVYYKFVVAAGETVRLSFDGAGDGINANELYVRQGSMPTRGQYDFAAREGFVTDPSLTIPTTQAGTYYVLAYGLSVSGSPAYAIKAEIIPFSITEVNATEVGNTGNVTLRIEGAKFGDNTEFSLVAADGTVTTAHEVYLDNSSEAYATFSLFGAAVGSYDVRAEQVIVQVDGTRLVLDTTTRVDAITVSEGLEAAVYMTITGPTDVMVNRTAIFTLNYVNEGGADSDVPLMVVESFSATPMGLTASDLHTTPLYILAASFDGPMDTLRPGARYSVPIVFKSGAQSGSLDIRVGRILTTDTRLITDWSAIEAGARPTGMDDAEWSTFWDRVQPLIGLTWGEYVQVLDRMMLLVSEPGNPVRDVREIFSRMMQLNPDYVPYNSLSGEVRDSETDLGLAGVQMAAYLLRADGSLEYKASALSGADGRFNFARLDPGQYSVVAIGQALDMDRDGQLDLTVPSVTLGHTSPGDAGTIYIQPPAGIGASTDSNPALNRDANGVTHMVWTREGMVWHAWFDTASGTWKDAQALSSEDGYGPVITSSDKLFDGTTDGTIVAWQQGKGNDANIWYAVARAKTGGGFEWSAPRQLTDIDPARDPADDVLDGAVQIIVGDTGTVMFTFIKRDAGVNGDGTGVLDDSDLYFEIWAFGEDEFTWPSPAEVVVIEDAGSDAALDPEGVSAAYGRQWKFGPWNVLGGSAELVLALSGTISENNCKVTLGAQGQIQGSVKGSNIRSTVSGNGAVTAEWGVNQAAKDWMFNSAKASVGASVQFDWRYGLSTLLSKIPHPAVTAAHLMYSLAVGLGSRLGLEFEDGITFGGGINISVMEWKLIQPFPDFVRPDGIFEADLSGTFGVYAQLDVGPTGDSVRVQGDITVTLGIEPVFKVKSVTGNITFSGNIGWVPFNTVFSVTLYNNESAEVISSDAQTQDVYLPIFDADALIGTGLAYGDNHVLADVSQDVTSDSAMTLAKDDGVIFGAWTHMAETRPDEAGWLGKVGWQVMVAEYGAGWGTPVALPGSLGVNGEATAAVDGNGRRMVIWTHAASPLSATPTLEDLEAAMDANNLVYALQNDDGTWGAMQTLATTAGADNGITTSRNAAGQLVVSWVFQAAGGIDRLMTSTWNGSTWSTASEIAFGASIMDPAMERLGDDLIVVWEVDANPDPEETEKSLYYSIFNGASWSAGAMFDPIAMATGMALSAGLPQATTADEDLSLLSGFPPFPVPEECLKCKPEEIKRIRESAPNCIDGGGTQVTFDEKTCTEKTIVYRPCVVRPRDPNDIIGPEGYGEEGWISSKGAFNYMIRFENAADASAPAQKVIITQQLDDDLDWRTFRIDDFGFSDQIINLDGKSAFYQTRLDYTADPTRGYFLDVSASVDVTTGIITWTMTTIDPATGDLPQEASIGFLPVNDTVYDPDDHDVVLVQGTGRGEGYVTYTVRAKGAAPTGTVVDAEARIIFDTEEPIDTPAIANTLDAGVPTSQVITFANATTSEGEFLVQWGGADDEAGSGLRDFSIYVSIDGSDFEIWLPDTTLTEAIYLGSEGHTYRFFSTVRDWAGNEEKESGVADATITVAGATGAISGTKFEDYDGDGVRDAGETGLAGWTIYLDADNNSVFDAGETSAVTGADGSYSFLDLDPGAYTVREVALAGWVQTAPGASGHTATVVSGETSAGVDFGNFALAQIGGQLFSDRNANGTLDDGEEGLSGWTLTLDKGGNGSIDATTTTDEYGYYRFTGVGPGSYTVMQVPQAGWLPTGPAGGKHTVMTTSGADIGGADFANVAAASIGGTKFEDMNGNGQRDVDERGLPGWTIFLDANANGSLDGGERFVITGSDGAYRFTDLLPGNYVIAEVMQDGWVQTSPGAGPSSNTAGVTLSLSGMDVVLSLPEDVVVEGDISIQAASANALADTLVGLDAFRADPRFAGITGTRVTTVVIDTGIDLNHSWFGPDTDNNGIADRIVYSYDFADQDANAGDLNGHGSHIASLIGGQHSTYGGVAPGADLIALKVFGDNGAGYFSYLEAALQWVVLNAAAYDVGVINLSLGDGGNWDTAISRYGLGDELAALAGMNILITAASGNNYFQYSGELGVAYPAADPAVLAVGAVWSGSFGGPVNYANGAADYSTGADRLAAFGQRDDALLDVLAPGTRMVGANYNGGTRTMFGTSQASAYMAGVATLAQDLALDHLGRKLSMAEFSSLLASTSVMVRDGDDENDNVENTGLDFARIDLLALAEGILALTAQGPGDDTDGGNTSTGGQTQPLAAPGVHQFSLAAGEQHTGTDFGNFLLGSISGTVFDDRNANAAQDGADAGLGGWTVFLDGNTNGQLDIGEHSTVTLANGSYRFNGIGPGSYHVSLIGQDGWTRTTAAAVDFPMTSGLQADADFGVNALPTLAAIGDMQVDEGSVLTFDASGTDDAADSLVYSLAGDSHGATIDASTGTFSWNAPDGNASTGFTLRVTDGAGGIAERSFTVTVANVAPSLTLTGAASVTDDQDFVLDLASSDPGQDTLTGWMIQWGDGSSSLLEAAAGTLAHRYAAPGDYTVLATASDEDGSYSTSTTVTVLPGTLKVSTLTATATGFQVRFNRGFVPDAINLYDSSFYNRGAADIALRDAAGRNVAGSVVLDDDHQGFSFVRTGGLLANGSYTVTLDSRANAFATAQGGLLDGNRDGTAGDHFNGGFSITGSGAVLRIGEFARGPGQAVDVPATAAGVPITISGATGAQQVSFTLAYDPALLAITGVSGGAGMPPGSTVGADFSTVGEVRITLSLGSALGAGSLELVRLSANVPGSAPYGAKQVLDLRDISLDTGAAVRDDDGLHLVAYVGDASGNAKYSTLDVQRIQRAVLRMDSGFGAYPLIDPVVVADINGNGALSSLDAQRVLSEVMGLDRAEIPPIPKGMTLTFSGPDPVVSAASVAGVPGETVVVPITLDTAAGLESVEITLLYPADSLALLDVRLGGLTQDFQYFVKDTSVPGRIVIDMARMSAMAGGAGTLVELEFRVADDAQGSLAIDLQATALNETRLTLNAESQPGLDPTDGRILLPVAQTPVVVVTTVQAPTPAAAPATVLPGFEIASPSVQPMVQPLPQIDFSQPVSFDAGARPSTGWVNDWVAGSRDTSTHPLKLNNWKLGAPVTRITSR